MKIPRFYYIATRCFFSAYTGTAMNIKLTADQKVPIYRPRDVFEIMREILMKDEKFDRDKEHFWVIGLHTNMVIAYVELVTLGLLNQTLVAPREVFRLAIQKGVATTILCHNHPSGNLTPSAEDIDVTKRLVQVGLIINITVQDHVIISTRSYTSMRDKGMWDEIVNDTKYKPQYMIEYEAEQKAERRKTLELASEMKKRGAEVQFIVDVTGLTEEEIEQL